jgi:hypothetical protein
MSVKQLELPLNHEPCLNQMAIQMADSDVASGYWDNWDSAYESAWDCIEEELAQQ